MFGTKVPLMLALIWIIIYIVIDLLFRFNKSALLTFEFFLVLLSFVMFYWVNAEIGLFLAFWIYLLLINTLLRSIFKFRDN